MENNYYTVKGYEKQNKEELSPAMEDYLEMIFRNQANGFIRIHTLAALLHVTPSAASKMAKKLNLLGFISFEPYGLIHLTVKGRKKGEYLLKRHNILLRFFSYLNQSEQELKLVEQIEHFIDERTISNMEQFLKNWE